jgi:hypothetical protein
MRFIASLIATMVFVVLATGAQAIEKNVVREVTRLASEVEGKIASKTDKEVTVEARGCWLHIDFASNNVMFDLPLLGTQVTKTDLEDGLVLQNNHMVRTVSSRTPETFEKLILKFGRYNTGEIMDSFEKAIKACGTQQAHAAGVPRT